MSRSSHVQFHKFIALLYDNYSLSCTCYYYSPNLSEYLWFQKFFFYLVIRWQQCRWAQRYVTPKINKTSHQPAQKIHWKLKDRLIDVVPCNRGQRLDKCMFIGKCRLLGRKSGKKPQKKTGQISLGLDNLKSKPCWFAHGKILEGIKYT